MSGTTSGPTSCTPAAGIDAQVDLERCRSTCGPGRFLPLDPVRQYSGEPTDEPTTIRIYTGNDGDFRWYEDDGTSLDYLKNNFSLDPPPLGRHRTAAHDRTRRQRGAAADPRELVVELVPSGEKKSVRYEGNR